MANRSDTAPDEPAKAVTANTSGGTPDAAPPAVSSTPSADTRGGAGTSTAEGPGRPTVEGPPSESGKDHAKTGAKDTSEVPPPGERVDDEHEDGTGKRMTRQE